MLSLETLKGTFEMVAYNRKKGRRRRGSKMFAPPTKLKAEDPGLIKDHATGPFDLFPIQDYQAVSIKRKQVDIMPATGAKTKKEHISDVKYTLPVDNAIHMMPGYQC